MNFLSAPRCFSNKPDLEITDVSTSCILGRRIRCVGSCTGTCTHHPIGFFRGLRGPTDNPRPQDKQLTKHLFAKRSSGYPLTTSDLSAPGEPHKGQRFRQPGRACGGPKSYE